MKCPWCWKKIAFMKRVDLDPAHPVDANGAPFLCYGCHQMSIVINDGRSLRKPTPREAHDLAHAQDIADHLPGGTFTPQEIDAIAADVRAQIRKGKP